MNLLIDTAPNYIVVRGKKININTSFSVWVEFLIACGTGDKEKTKNVMLKIFEKVPNENAEEVITECVRWLFSESTSTGTNNKEADKSPSSPASFDFEIDGNVIYCELWEYFPHLMQRGITYHEGMELIKLLMHNDKTMLWHRAFARTGDFSKMDKEQKKYWQNQRAIFAIPNSSQRNIDDVFANAF